MIYHYTSIDSLALILKSKKIRFTRLDQVDDVREAQEHAGINFGQYFFVSCWTTQNEESIPQWNMYSKNMQGVRLELPKYPFNVNYLQSNPEITGMVWDGVAASPLTLEELSGNTYFIQPLGVNENFSDHVNYVENVTEIYQKSINKTVKSGGGVNVKIENFFNLPKLKSIDWKFQKEYRFSLFAMPLPEGARNIKKSPKGIGELMSSSIIQNIDPKVSYVDVKLSREALSKIVVRTGPLCSEAGKICVEAIVSHLAPGAKIKNSSLEGCIR